MALVQKLNPITGKFDLVNDSTGISSLNSQTGANQTFATGSSGTDFGIVSSGDTHTFNIPTASGSARGLLAAADWTTFNGKESALTFSTGLTRSSNTITADLSTGKAGGQSVIGGTASGNNLTLSSTTHATKGKIIFGTSAYDEVNNRLGIGTTSPATNAVINRSTGITTIQGGSANDSTLLLRVNTDGATGNAIEFQYGSSGAYLGSRIVSEIVSGGGADLFFQTGTNGAGTYTSKLTIKRDGNVGVGLTAPGSKFGVEDTNKTVGTTSADVNAAIHTTTSQAADVGGTIALGGLIDNSGNRRNFGIIGGRKTNGTNANTSGYLFFSTNLNGTGMVERMRILDTGNVGIGTTSPTAVLHLKAGTATANTAPLKLTTGTLNTTPETGAMEYDGTNLFFTRTGTTRESVWCGNSGATAPSTASGTPTTRYGGDTNYLGDPNSWASVVIGGTTYKVPLYT